MRHSITARQTVCAVVALGLFCFIASAPAQERAQYLQPDLPTREVVAALSTSPEVMAWRKHLLEIDVQRTYGAGHEKILEDMESVMISSGAGAIGTPNELMFPNSPHLRRAATIGRGTPFTGLSAVGLLFSGKSDPYTDSKCTLTLIEPGVVLTAAHCINNSHDHLFWSYFVFEGFRQMMIDEAVPFCNSVYADPSCDPGVADLAIVPLDEKYNFIPPLSSGLASNALHGALATIVGFGISGPYLADFGIKRVGEVQMGDCAIFTASDESICFSFDSANKVANCGNDSGGPMVSPIAGGGRIVGVAAQSSTYKCGTSGEGRYVNTTFAAYKDFLDDHACPGGCAPSDAVILLENVPMQLLDAANPTKSYLVNVPSNVNELIVTLNHERGWYSSPNKLSLTFPAALTLVCREFVEAKVCKISAPAPGPHSIDVNLVQGAAGFQLGIVGVP